MRLPLVLGTGALMTGVLLMGGLVVTALDPMPVVNVDAMDLDGASLLSSPLPEVSPRPQLVVRVSRAIKPGDWRVVMDGRPVNVSAASTGAVLRVALPGPMPLSSRHTVQLAAGAMQIRTAFKIVPPLTAAINMHLYHLQAGAQPIVATTIRFSRPVADKTQAQDHLVVSGNPTFTWQDAQTVDVISTGFRLADQATAVVDAGIQARDGTFSRESQSAGLTIPSTLTQVEPGRMVQMYYVNTDDGRASLFAHLKQIDVLSPAWYDANADGTIKGYARRDVIDAAHANGIAIIPLVVNKDVDPDVGHAILSDPARRAALAGNLVNEAKTYGYAGFQLDFEQIPWTDRDLLTALVQDCAAAFHAAGLNLSIAVIPRLPGDAAASGTLLDYFHQWSGAYDFAALAKAADFLSFMTYDEHNGVTPPGPVSGTPWMRRALEFSMQGVPPEKATLGLPTYYHDWTGVGRLTSSSYSDAMILAQSHGTTPALDTTEEELHFAYTAYGVHHELWVQSTDTLRRKLPLMYEYGLKGISVWRLGFEDPSFWNLIPPRH
ncbi:MAG TPA: glycosyl hydrolase family 18 protein [Candidatus Dormibacteraeota bacterium]|nr:glycosyl hydrolase family 18 protein [Candidatus Dormibacteraeota bacterium]